MERLLRVKKIAALLSGLSGHLSRRLETLLQTGSVTTLRLLRAGCSCMRCAACDVAFDSMGLPWLASRGRVETYPCTIYIFFCRSSIGAPKLAHNGDKEKILMHRWRFPSLSLHGIEGTGFTLTKVYFNPF